MKDVDISKNIIVGKKPNAKTIMARQNLDDVENKMQFAYDEVQLAHESIYEESKDSDTNYLSWLARSNRPDNIANWTIFRLTGGIAKHNFDSYQGQGNSFMPDK